MKLVFVFSGHGTQSWNMGRQLLEEEPLFRVTVEECDSLARQYVSWSLLEELLADESHSRLDSDHVEITQTALFATQVALAALWHSWGIEPDAVVGYCMGEVAASHVAGILSLSEAIRVIVARSSLYQRALRQADKRGAMAWVNLSSNEARQLLDGYKDRLWLAAHNSPVMTMLSGDAMALEELLQSLRRKKIAYGLMRTPGAGHTPQVEFLARKLVRSLDGLQPQRGFIPIFSSVTGDATEGTEFDADYWGRQLREPILFAEAMDSLVENGHDVFLEIGGKPILSTPIRHCLRHRGKRGIVLASLHPGKNDREAMLGSLRTLFDSGMSPIDRPARAIDRSEQGTAFGARDGSVTYLSAHDIPRASGASRSYRRILDRRSGTDRRTGWERRKLRLADEVIEVKFGGDRRSGLDRRSGNERRAAVG